MNCFGRSALSRNYTPSRFVLKDCINTRIIRILTPRWVERPCSHCFNRTKPEVEVIKMGTTHIPDHRIEVIECAWVRTITVVNEINNRGCTASSFIEDTLYGLLQRLIAIICATQNLTPLSSPSLTSCFAKARSVVIPFSTRTCKPASNPTRAKGACVSVGVQINAASASTALVASSRLEKQADFSNPVFSRAFWRKSFIDIHQGNRLPIWIIYHNINWPGASTSRADVDRP